MTIALEGNVKPCADGDHYAPVDQLTEMPDGRLVCADCIEEKRRRIQARAQQHLFISQDSLFDSLGS